MKSFDPSESFRVTRLPALALLALAACWACAAQAQSSVQVYGLLDMGVGSYRDAGGGRSSQVASGKMTTSYLGYKGTEDLGGGLAAFFALESHLRIDTGEPGRNATDPYFSRNAYVGLLSRTAGSITLGRYNTPFWLASVSTNPFGASTGYSPGLRLLFGPIGKTGGDGVWNNSVIYETPRIGGFGGMVQHQMKETAQGGNTGANITYNAGGPLVLAAAAQSIEAPYTRGKETAAMVGGSYNLGFARAFGQYARVNEGNTSAATANTRDRIYQVGASIPVGTPGAVLVSYAQARTSGAQIGDRKVFSIGYDYRLSRRTDVYTVLMTDKYNALRRGDSFGVGIRHIF